MNSALRLRGPGVVLEHVDLYGSSGDGPGRRLRLLPAGRQGGGPALRLRTVTVLTYLAMTTTSCRPSSRSAPSTSRSSTCGGWTARASDWDTIGDSIKKTNRVVIAEQGPRGTSYGGWLADEIQRRFFDWLDHPVERVSGSEASPSISKRLERAAIAQADEVVAALTAIAEA
jgi:2-oxoisovalerate dehydrogenase E1 component